MASSLASTELTFVADQAIMASRRALARVGLFCNDFSKDAEKLGTKLKVMVFGGGEAGEFNASTNNYETVDGDVKWADLEFDHHVKSTFSFSEKDAFLANNVQLWTNAGKAAGRKVAKKIEGLVAGLMTYSNAKATVQSAISKADFAMLRKVCADNDMDPLDTVVVLNSTAHSTLLGALDSDVYGGSEGIRSGVIRDLYGFKGVLEMPNLPVASSATDGDTKAWGCLVPADAIAIGCRRLQPQSTKAYDEVGWLQDEASGLTLGLRRHTAPRTGDSFVTVECLLAADITYDATNASTAPRFVQLKTA